MANISVVSVRKTKPTFSLTNKVNIPIYIRSGKWVGGKWVEVEDDEPMVIEGNVQPLRYHEILQMPESDRTKEWKKIYTTYEVHTSQEPSPEGVVADHIEWNGKKFKIMSVQTYEMGILDHTKFLVARDVVSAGF